MDLEDIVLNEESDSEKQILYDITRGMWDLKKIQSNRNEEWNGY